MGRVRNTATLAASFVLVLIGLALMAGALQPTHTLMLYIAAGNVACALSWWLEVSSES